MEDILKEIDVMLKAPRFGRWMGTTSLDQKNDSDARRQHDSISVT